jgi:hypothetical protein
MNTVYGYFLTQYLFSFYLMSSLTTRFLFRVLMKSIFVKIQNSINPILMRLTISFNHSASNNSSVNLLLIKLSDTHTNNNDVDFNV